MGMYDYKKLDVEIRDKAKQRKEENQVFYSTHLQDLVGGDEIAEEVFNEESSEAESGFFDFSREEYKFAKFSDLTFGTEANEYLKISGICFYYCDFSMCGYSNISFENCSFVGCNFSECYTLGFAVVYDHCSFTSRIQGESNIDDAPCTFSGCELSAKFVDSDVSMGVFEKSHFYFSNFNKVDLRDAIFIDCSLDTTKMGDCDLRNTKILNAKFTEFYIEDSMTRTKVSKHTFLGLINFDKKENREVRFAADVYSQFSELFENNKFMDSSGEYFYLYKKTERLNMKGIANFKSFIGMITCGYGERPFFSLISSMFLVLTCGTLYMFFGVNFNNEVISFHPTMGHLFPPLDQLVIWYHFSLVTFSTVGYGNVVPVGGSLIVSAFEMVLGIIMVGIWVSTLVRKMVR